MKKKLLFGALGALFLGAGVLTVTSLSAKEQMSYLMLANIEAITQGAEVDAGYVQSVNEITTIGNPYFAGGQTCYNTSYTRTCSGNGLTWCTSASSSSVTCY